ncbi:MAG: 23S rRNA (guanosine(2251)-2'-O)-methyltransferase RlmB [Bacteroidetes bacterium]|nr:23S rRNA (guanosine(2251)-2'-O)-methyltransferase RlmB [Bacteroidota bacterium]MBU1719088.1 23S rRNA (guanosine(2251)-2'-O)-methyltransferase RlmB [Bacteroidota bacterium]
MKNKNIIFGIRPIIEAVQAGKEVEKVLVKQGLQGELYAELRDVLRKASVPVHAVPEVKLDSYTNTGKMHQGVIGFVSEVHFTKLSTLVQQVFESGETPLILVLDRITDVRNFGAIARTAECAGVHGIVVPTRGGALIGGDAMKTSAGALMNIPVCREPVLENTITFLKDCGLQTIACTEKGTVNHSKPDLKLPTAIVMGSEEDGITPTVIRLCDIQAAIPMLGSTGSLNVSVAAGVMIYEAIRQRGL